MSIEVIKIILCIACLPNSYKSCVHVARFVEWFIIDNYGENFTRYDVDNSGEVDIHELRTAIAEWALYAKETTAAAAHRQAAARERKLQLKEGRRLMLENADARAAEIMELCLLNGASSLTITVFGMRTHLEPVPRLKPFVDWMLKDRMRVWKKYDADKSGTIGERAPKLCFAPTPD